MRGLLLALALVLAAAGSAEAFGSKTQLRLGVLDIGAGGDERIPALQRLAYEIRKRTSIEAAPDVATVPLEAEKLFAYPLVVAPVCREPAPLTDAQVRLLRRYLDTGGMLFIDNCQGRSGGAAERWARAEASRLYPERALKPLAADHSVTRSFYLLDRAYGRTTDRADLEGIDEGDRTVVLYHPDDLLGALLRDPFGNPIFDVPERQREFAQRQGVNIVLYALTLNYKKDQIHIPFILKRRRQ